ncbi:hypothetical protein PUNSTDRAFT_52071, partial [Punctularia strigosozonata HHB-11173 SS5]|uniref:uncharacterized protein n=1 Tax=Punctularia strigosozonata (strain HHB-11173) TaxID=741275 RepID=UPI00044182C9
MALVDSVPQSLSCRIRRRSTRERSFAAPSESTLRCWHRTRLPRSTRSHVRRVHVDPRLLTQRHSRRIYSSRHIRLGVCRFYLRLGRVRCGGSCCPPRRTGRVRNGQRRVL